MGLEIKKEELPILLDSIIDKIWIIKAKKREVKNAEPTKGTAILLAQYEKDLNMLEALKIRTEQQIYNESHGHNI